MVSQRSESFRNNQKFQNVASLIGSNRSWLTHSWVNWCACDIYNPISDIVNSIKSTTDSKFIDSLQTPYYIRLLYDLVYIDAGFRIVNMLWTRQSVVSSKKLKISFFDSLHLRRKQLLSVKISIIWFSFTLRSIHDGEWQFMLFYSVSITWLRDEPILEKIFIY